MFQKVQGFTRWLVMPALLGLVVALAPAAIAGFDEQYSFSADELVVRNLIGAIEVQGHSGSDFQVEVHVRGEDASRDQISIETSEGRTAVVRVEFPVKKTKHFVYPPLGRREVNTSLDDGDSGSWLSQLLHLGSGKLHVTGNGSGLEVWADIVVKVPRGASVEIDHGVGDITATGVDGDLLLDSHVGSVETSGITGSLTVDTGSGSVRVEDQNGELSVDTGSGSVKLAHCDSGGRDITVDTGSGSVSIEDARARHLNVDTGSGGVEATRVDADAVGIDTGSGSVEIELAGMGGGKFEIDTGSGGIELYLPADASADIRASTGSGGIDLDLSGDYNIREKERDEAHVIVGGGEADVVLDTGSGRIRVRQ